MSDRLFDVGALPQQALSPVLAFDPAASTNAQRVADLARLGYLPEPVLDPTFGMGGMWERYMPDRLVATDLDRRRARDVQCDFTALPFKDQAFASCILDPPYKLTGDRSGERLGNHGELAVRFGTITTRRTWRLIEQAIVECGRVTSRVLIVKCADQIETGGYVWQVGQVVVFATSLGWKLDGQMHLMSSVPQPPGRPQVHIRNNASTFVILVR